MDAAQRLAEWEAAEAARVAEARKPANVHIRPNKPAKRGGSQWYRAAETHVPTTLCGAPVGSYDLDVRSATTKKGRTAPCCPKCRAILERTSR